MPYTVTSDFVDNSRLYSSEPVREFTIGSSNYSTRVLKWPRVSKEWNHPKSVPMSIELANADQGMNFLRLDKTLLSSICTTKIGYDSELITVQAGKIDSIKYTKGKCVIRFLDKMKQLSERLIGDRDTPVTYTNELLSDVAWWAVTSYGGYDVTTSTANTDIDWTMFMEWAAIMSGDNIRVSANFEGIKITEALRKISRISESAIYVENDKLVMSRFSSSEDASVIIEDDPTIGSELYVKDSAIINRQLVNAGYNVTSKSFAITVYSVDTASVNSFGIREEVEEDRSIWFTTSLSALNLAERKIFMHKLPLDEVKVTTPLTSLITQLGDTVFYGDSLLNFGENFKVLERTLDMNTGKVSLVLDRSQLVNPFILDVTSLDGTEVLT